MYTTIDDFLRHVYSLLSNVQKLQLIFVSGNGVLGYDSGIVPIETLDIEIAIQHGLCYSVKLNVETQNEKYKPYCTYFFTGAIEPTDNCIIPKLLIPQDTTVLTIVYGGKREFMEALLCAQTIRQSVDTHLFFLTCDCQKSDKLPTLDTLVRNKTIDDFIITPQCGGENDLRKIITSITSYWAASH